MSGKQIPIEEALKNAFSEEWVFTSDTPSEGLSTIEALRHHNTDHSEHISVTPRTLKKI